MVANLIDDTAIKGYPHDGFDFKKWCYKSAPLSQEIDKGHIFSLGNCIFRVIRVPGPSLGSVALWEKETGLLFTVDVIYDDKIYDHLYYSIPEILCESFKRLRELPITTVHAGHHQSFGRYKMQVIIDEYLLGQLSMVCPRIRK